LGAAFVDFSQQIARNLPGKEFTPSTGIRLLIPHAAGLRSLGILKKNDRSKDRSEPPWNHSAPIPGRALEGEMTSWTLRQLKQ
jgi:hypothetical protein